MVNSSVFITSREVIDFVNSFSLSRSGYQNHAQIFEDLLRQLRAQQNLFSEKEREAYNIFGVDGVKGLQEAFDQLNKSGLINFSSNYLTKIGGLLSKFGKRSDFEVTDIIAQKIAASPELREMSEEQSVEFIVQKLTEIIKEQRNLRSKTKTGRAYVKTNNLNFKNLAAQIYAQMKKQGSSSFEIPKAYKKDLTAYVQEVAPRKEGFAWEMSIADVPILDKQAGELSYYPYYGLTEEQKVEALKRGEKWGVFKSHIAAVAHMTEGEDRFIVDSVLDALGPAAFIKPEGDFNGVKGILGEVQAALIIQKLTKGKHTVLPSGRLRNEAKTNRPELGADVLIDGITGIQVKNYSGFLTKEGNKGYHLMHDPISWKTVEKERFKGKDLTELGTFIAAKCYNIPLKSPVPKDYEKTLPAYKKFYTNRIDNKSGSINLAINSYLAANLDKFITVDEEYRMITQDLNSNIQSTIRGEYWNVFFIFSGETIVPTSRIYGALINRVEELYRALSGRGAGSTINFTSSLSYRGPVWHIPETKEPYPSLDTVLSDVFLRTQLNIYLPDLDL